MRPIHGGDLLLVLGHEAERKVDLFSPCEECSDILPRGATGGAERLALYLRGVGPQEKTAPPSSSRRASTPSPCRPMAVPWWC